MELNRFELSGKRGDLPEGGHGHDRVPEGGGYRREVGAVHVLLRVEHDRGEDDDGHGEREHEEAELRGAALERVAEDAQALRVARKFENPEHAEHAQRHERPCSHTSALVTISFKSNRL